jgi:hypothetical protein
MAVSLETQWGPGSPPADCRFSGTPISLRNSPATNTAQVLWRQHRRKCGRFIPASTGQAVELYLTDGDRLFIVADEADAARLSEPRGTIYTAAEIRLLVRVTDPQVVAEVRRWKREFNATVRDLRLWRGDHRE